ncbi:MAG: hypothetical protein ACQCN5_02755 [Candidatus Bathyarchaeia archaeon]
MSTPIGLCDFAHSVMDGDVLDVDGYIGKFVSEGLQFFRSVAVVVLAHP